MLIVDYVVTLIEQSDAIDFYYCSYSLFRSWGRVGTEIGGTKLEVTVLCDCNVLIVGLYCIRISVGTAVKP